MDALAKALALARLGIKVFPCDEKTRAPSIAHKDGGRGFYDATIDFELIATWFSVDFPKAVVGVWTGGSGLLGLDLDRGKKSGKDGFVSLDKAGLLPGGGYTYPTPSGGEHHIWRATGDDLTPGGDVSYNGEKLAGVDIRAGGSYFIWWGDEVPEELEEIPDEATIPPWVRKAATVDESTFTGEGFSGSVQEWLNVIPDDVLPSSSTRYFMDRIPTGEFGHPEMVSLAWELVRLGSERETGVKVALEALKAAWLRGKYNTPDYRRDFDMALRGGINKAGRVQLSTPSIPTIEKAMAAANELGVGSELRALERKVSGNLSEIELARFRKEMFKIGATGGLSPSMALGIVVNSKSFLQSAKVSISSAWFGDGEPFFHDAAVAEEEDEGFEGTPADPEEELRKLVMSLATKAEEFSFLSEVETTTARAYDWWGREYLDWVKTQIKHFNKPYHVAAMWSSLSVMLSSWGKVPNEGYKLTDCNLYFVALGDSSSGKSEAWGFGKKVVNSYFSNTKSPIIGDVKRSSALSVHRSLILRDKEPSLVYSDEVQGFFQDIQTSHWQGTLLGDLSDYYGGDVSPKNTMNDKELAGKSAQSLLTVYLTGIADMSLDAISIDNWKSGLFYRFLWAFGEPRQKNDHKKRMMTPGSTPDIQIDIWAREFQKRHEQQNMKWSEGRRVDWTDEALDRFNLFTKAMEDATVNSPLYETVFVSANGRFETSITKAATLVALSEMAEKVTLAHLLVALDFAGPWHKSMMLAVEETGKTPFDRDTERLLVWMRRNAIRQLDKLPVVQRASVMRQFKPNEVAERLLRQLTEEGWIRKSGDSYEILEG